MGQITVSPTPDMASWILAGPLGYSYEGVGEETLADLDAGIYRVTWGALSGYATPTVSYLELSDDGEEAVAAVYLETMDCDPLLMREAVIRLIEAGVYTSDWKVERTIGPCPAARWCLTGCVQVDLGSEAERNGEWSDDFGSSENVVTTRVMVFAKHAGSVEMRNLIANRVAMLKQALKTERNDLGESWVLAGSVEFGQVNYMEISDEDGHDIAVAALTVSAVYLTDPGDRHRPDD